MKSAIEPFQPLVRSRIRTIEAMPDLAYPDIGQGGCAAMEDAVVLGVFRQTRDIAAARSEALPTEFVTWCEGAQAVRYYHGRILQSLLGCARPRRIIQRHMRHHLGALG